MGVVVKTYTKFMTSVKRGLWPPPKYCKMITSESLPTKYYLASTLSNASYALPKAHYPLKQSTIGSLDMLNINMSVQQQ